MGLSTKLSHLDLHSTFFTGSSSLLDVQKPVFRPHLKANSVHVTSKSTTKYPNSLTVTPFKPPTRSSTKIALQSSTATLETAESDAGADIESLFSDDSSEEIQRNRNKNQQSSSSISSGVKLENISKSYKGVNLLKNVSWEVKKGEKVGLVGVNGAGKTTQLRIITGQEQPDSGNVIKAKPNMKIAFLNQEFEVSLSRTVREEFTSAFKEEMDIARKLERVQKALEGSVEDLELMGRLLDEFDLLQRRAQAVDLDEVDAKVSKLMPELGFTAEDADRLVASFSSGWQMRMSLGKILLQVS